MTLASEPPRPWRKELRPLGQLAIPLILGHAGSQLMSVVDTAMVGRLGAAALGGSGIAASLWFALSCMGLGLVLGAETLIAQAVGAGERAAARAAFGHALLVAVLAGVPLTALTALLPLAFPALGIEPETAREAARGLYGRLPQILPFLLFSACRSYLQAHGRTRPIVLATVLANVLNVIGNLVLIFGDGGLRRVGLPAVGLPPLGVLGSGLSTSLSQIGALLLLAAAARRAGAEIGAPGAAPVRPAPVVAAGTAESLRRIARIGVPISLLILAEIGAFSIGALLCGRLGPAQSAAHQVAITLASFTFTVTLGIGAAAAVRVGHHVGAGDAEGARRAGLVAIGLSLCFMGCSALTFFFGARGLAALLSSDPVVQASAAPLILIAAAFQLFDGAQSTAAGALRGAGDTRVAFLANLVGYYVLGIPTAVLLVAAGMGARGVWWGLTLGLGCVAVWLVLRFASVTRGPIARA